MADISARPIDRVEYEQLFACLADYHDVFLAVSGGVDSWALMHLAAAWRAKARWPGTLHVLCVNHGLRPEAAGEAQHVAAQAARLNLRVTVLNWEGRKPTSGIQEAARLARYQLMLEEIRRVSAEPKRAVLVTAHHRDDLAETVLMRLARGAGVDGLSAIGRLTWRDGIALVRPFLDVTKARLRATMDAAGERWLEDPSNANPDFERVQLRSARQAGDPLGLENDMLALTAQRMQRARAALERMTDDWLGPHLAQPVLGRYGVFAWPWQVGDVPDEVAVRALTWLLRGIGGRSAPVRLMRIERLWEDMQQAGFAGATLGNCVITGAVRGPMYIYREPRRAALPEVELVPGRALIWDKRFAIDVADATASRLHVRALAESDLMAAGLSPSLLAEECPIDALFATPVITHDAGILVIPALKMHGDAASALIAARMTCRFLVERIETGIDGAPERSGHATD